MRVAEAPTSGVRTESSVGVLHVDDEPDFAEMTAEYLERDNPSFEVTTANDPAEALSLLEDRGKDFDCVVSDYSMPGKNGIELLSEVREGHPELPFILFTGKGSEEVASEAISKGVTDYLQKEPSTEQYKMLANRIENAVNMRRSERELRESCRRLNMFFEKSPLGVIEWDEEFRLVRMNERAEEILGYGESEIEGGSWERIVPESDREEVAEVVDDLLGNAGGYHSVNENVTKDDETVVCEWHNRVVTDELDETVAVFSQFQDVTDRAERESELERYETFIESTSDVVLHLDEDGTILYNNSSTRQLSGYDSEETIGDGVFEYVHPDDRERAAERLRLLSNDPEKDIDTMELRMLDADGDYVWVEAVGTDRTGTDVGGFVVSARDITERKEREKELERYEALVDNTTDLITLVDEEGEVLYQSPSSERVLGYDPEEAVGNNVFDLVHPDDRERVEDEFSELIENPEAEIGDSEYRFLRADGDYVWFKGSVTDRRNTALSGLLTVARDITDRKKRERELERSQDLLRKTERIASTGGWELDVGMNDLRWTGGTREIHGVPDDYEPTLDEAIDFYHPDDRETIRRAVERCRDEGEPFDEELRIYAQEGRMKWVHTRGEPIRVPDSGSDSGSGSDPDTEEGEIGCVRGSIQDVTEEKGREMELLRNNMAVRGLYETTADPDLSFDDKVEMVLESCRSRLDLEYAFVMEIDPEAGTQKITHARGAHEFLQPGESCPLEETYCRETIEGDGLLAVLEAEEDDRVAEEAYGEFGLGSYIGAKLSVDDELHGTLCFADEEPREKPFTEFERTLVELMSKWVSYELERRESNERLRRQKERLDDFASVVSHDLRSPLTVLMGNLELAEETGETDYLDSCRDAVDRMESIIDDLLSLARDVDDTGETEAVALADVTEECWRNTDTKDAKLRVETENSIMANRGKLRQMLENLLRNSVVHGGDDVTVTVSDLPGGNGFRIEDDGVGIPEDERASVFEPGYATGESGTGLGMYIVKQVAEAHGWGVEVVDGEEGGAAFEVTGVRRAES